MTLLDIAALTTAGAALLTALAQWVWLVGPRRNGRQARLNLIESRLATTEQALDDCTRRLGRLRRLARRRRLSRPAKGHSSPIASPESIPPAGEGLAAPLPRAAGAALTTPEGEHR